jgi:hypothetical protein
MHSSPKSVVDCKQISQNVESPNWAKFLMGFFQQKRFLHARQLFDGDAANILG